jgi:hypothetical protein
MESTSISFFLTAGAGNYDEIVGCHNPKGVIADYWDFDEDPHNRS